MSDRLADGWAFRVVSLVDNVSRVSPALEAYVKMTGERVCEVLNRAIVAHGLPKTSGGRNTTGSGRIVLWETCLPLSDCRAN